MEGQNGECSYFCTGAVVLEYLNLPRNIRDIAYNEEYTKIIRDDSFTEFVWSCYAYANWHFFLLPVSAKVFFAFPSGLDPGNTLTSYKQALPEMIEQIFPKGWTET